jgi:hypothetical protein
MKRSTGAIALLLATNLASVGYIAWRVHSPAPDLVLVDHLEDMRLKSADGTLQARVGDSSSHSNATIIFTPHGAVQFHHELGRMFVLIEKKAAESSPQAQAATPESPRPAL